MLSLIGLDQKSIRRAVIVFTLLISLLFVKTVAAHPLGNFSINRYSRLQLTDETVELRYIVDMAEIPALQNRPKIDTDSNDILSDGELATYTANLIPQLTANLDLSIDGQPIELTVSEQSLTFPEGQGGLLTQRLVIDFAGVLPAQDGEIFYEDGNYADRLGWTEIVVDSAKTLSIEGASVPVGDISAELTTYPDDLLQSPLTETSIVFSLVPAVGAATSSNPSAVSTVAETNANRYGTDRFAELITIEELTPRIIAVALLLAFGLGAAHALTPGHGKTIVGAYLVGSRGTAKHALFLGLTTTITHTAGVFFFGLLVLFASRFIVPEDLFPWLGVMSGLLVVFIGASLARAQWQKRAGVAAANPHDQPEDYHTHFGIGHSHVPNNDDAPSFGSLLALGISGGLIPCPSALVVLLSAIALQRVGFGLILILVFSIGLATVLTLLGIIFVVAGKRLEGVAQSNGRLLRMLPVVSACFVTLAGVGITYQALLQTGLFS